MLHLIGRGARTLPQRRIAAAVAQLAFRGSRRVNGGPILTSTFDANRTIASVMRVRPD
jgi:hypothetical protein